MELDSKNLGRLRRVADPRKVWVSESGDFTPWLAENIDVLADELGLTLTVVGTEIAVGDFRVDIQAEDGDGRPVVIENQLDRTDHNHLGQCLVYAAGLEASTVIWITTQFRDDFRRALDWLNERTDKGVQFFGVEVSVVQISDSGPRAPVFEVVSRPNDWQKEAKSSGGISGKGQATAVNEARQDLFAEILETVIADRPSIRMPARARGNWLPFASGPFGYWSVSVIADGRLRVEAYLDCGDQDRNKALLDQFALEAEKWSAAVGTELTFERLDDKRASRIAVHHALDIDDDASRSDASEWAAQTIVAMYDAMNEPLRARAARLREAAAQAVQGAVPVPPADRVAEVD